MLFKLKDVVTINQWNSEFYGEDGVIKEVNEINKEYKIRVRKNEDETVQLWFKEKELR